MQGVCSPTTLRGSLLGISELDRHRKIAAGQPKDIMKEGIGRKKVSSLRCSENRNGSDGLIQSSDSNVKYVDINEAEAERMMEEVSTNQGIRIRRRSPTGSPLHYVGPFEFRIESEGSTPRNILEEIIWHKNSEVSQLKEGKPLFKLRDALGNASPVRDFIGALKEAHLRTDKPALIAEVKKASPSRGVLREHFDPVQIAQAYEAGGAACLSVLTDEKYFQGSFANLEAIRNAGIKCPILCKEFIIDAWQIYYARTKGADAILLIAAVLPDLDIRYMTKICKKLGLTALVEVHNEEEMDRVLGIDGIELVGINNRDLETFNVDISTTRRLLEGERGKLIREKDIIVVGESGLFTPDDISYVQKAGVKAVLVGESIVKQNDPVEGIRKLLVKGPSGEQIHDSRDKTSDMFEFVVNHKGLHRFCFINKSPYHETIDFDMHVAHFAYYDQHAKDEHVNPLLEQIAKLEEALYNVQFEQHWLEAQTDRQALVNEQMSRRAIYKAIFESAALIGASVLQVYLLRRLLKENLVLLECRHVSHYSLEAGK